MFQWRPQIEKEKPKYRNTINIDQYINEINQLTSRVEVSQTIKRKSNNVKIEGDLTLSSVSMLRK